MLNRKSVYALHALHTLARNPSERFSTARLAEHSRSPRRFLEQILSELRSAELVHSVPGRNGGYQLALAPEAISLADVLRVVEGPIALLPCASHRFYEPCPECANPEACALQDALVHVRNETVHALKSISLADLVARETELSTALRGILRPTPYLRTP
ncbi:MAG: RrF2 family transcriptional regulator [Schleiferiaceae bacterium]|jgi:Rrf2 family protein